MIGEQVTVGTSPPLFEEQTAKRVTQVCMLFIYRFVQLKFQKTKLVIQCSI